MGFWAAAIPAALNIAGDMLSQTSARSAYRSRYQDTVKDMRKAGLNPALAYGQNPGGGAQTADFGDIGSKAAGAMSAAASARQASATAENTKAQTGLLQAQTADLIQNLKLRNEVLGTEAAVNRTNKNLNTERFNREKLARERDEATQDALVRQTLAESLLSQLQIPGARAMARFFNSPTGRASPYVNLGANVVNSAANAYRAYRGGPHNSTTTGSAGGRTYYQRTEYDR